jgi:hypothetical protein
VDSSQEYFGMPVNYSSKMLVILVPDKKSFIVKVVEDDKCPFSL